jgi:hypothetical protein
VASRVKRLREMSPRYELMMRKAPPGANG